MSARIATVSRDTNETQITVSVNLDGEGRLNCETGVPFLDHMLDQVARHGMVDLDIHPKATCISTTTTPLKIWASPWARHSTRPLAISAASTATATLMCRWMRRSLG